MGVLLRYRPGRVISSIARRKRSFIPTTMFYDVFDGASGALTSHVPNVGSSWSAQASAVYTLTGSGAIQCDDTGSDGIGVVLAVAAASYPQYVTITFNITNADNGSSGIVFNYVDANNHWRLDVRNGVVEKVAGGTPTTQITGTPNLSASQRIILTPTSVVWAQDSVSQGSCARTTPTGTAIGTYCDGSEASTGGTWDNFKIAA